MRAFQVTLWTSFVSCGVVSLLTLQAGSRLADRSSWLKRLGDLAHRRKLRALRTVWPLKKLPGAIARRSMLEATAILTPLILAKSVVAVPLGLLFLPWLPFAGLLVSVMVMTHDPDEDGEVRRWALKVSRLQMTSHAAAAAVGFAVTLHGPLVGRPLDELLAAQWVPIAVLLMLSVLSGLAAGWREAEGVVLRGYLDRELEEIDRA